VSGRIQNEQPKLLINLQANKHTNKKMKPDTCPTKVNNPRINSVVAVGKIVMNLTKV